MSNQFFLVEEENARGQFDWNADLYAQKQQQFANDLEDSIGFEFWPTKPRFAEYDFHIVNPNNSNFSGTCSIVPGTPILGVAELKYRTNGTIDYPDTVVDTDKMVKMRDRVRNTNLPAYIFFRFTDDDRYYRVDLDDEFKQSLNRNTNTTADVRWELKPLTHIPVHKLKSVKDIRERNG
jgi:hypothetical protein